MNPPTVSSTDTSPASDPVRLSRLRLPPRTARAVAPPGAMAQLPDARLWALLLGEGPVSAAECAALNAIARSRIMAPGSAVFVHADLAMSLLAMTEGDVALGMQAPDSDFRTERHLHGPAWLDLSAGWLRETYAHDARALTAVKLLELPRDALFDVADRYPSLWRRLGAALASEVRGLAMNAHDLMHKDAPARLAAWLMLHCQPAQELGLNPALQLNRGLVQMTMRKRDIASQLAITPETLSRLMRSFSSQGMIRVSGYTVHVLDAAALQRTAQG